MTTTTQISAFIVLSDPEVVAAISEVPEGQERDDYLSQCVKVGVLALRAARGLVNGNAVRDAGDRLIEQLAAYRSSLEQNMQNTLMRYFDPSSGLFPARVEALVKNDGELSRLMAEQVRQVQSQFDGMAAAFAPDDSNKLLQTMRAIMRESGDGITAQFSLDDPASALSRLVRDLTSTHGSITDQLAARMNDVVGEFSLDKPDSALSRLVGRVESTQRSITAQFSLDDPTSALSRLKSELHGQMEMMGQSQQVFQLEVTALLSALSAKREADSKSTAHGMVFEECVGAALRKMGDIVDGCGATTGLIRASKVGDFTVTLPPEHVAAGARIVVEAKESNGYTLSTTLAEADEARRNRGAAICLFVHSARYWGESEPLTRYGNDVVVVWDAEDSRTDIVLRAGYTVAKALSVREAVRGAGQSASFAKVDKAVEVVRKQIEGFTEIVTSGETVTNGAAKILNRARIMRGELEKSIELLAEEFATMKDAA